MSSETISLSKIIQTPEFESTKNYFMDNLSCLIFRRIETISDIKKLRMIVYQTPFSRYEFNTKEKYEEFISKKGIAYDNKNTIFYYKHYSFTSKTVLRGNDPTYGFRDHIFHGDTANIGIFLEDHLIIQEMPKHKKAGYPLPKIGQLVAGYRYEFNNHVYRLWFLCSEQLLHAFSALFTEEVTVVDNGKDIWEQEIISGESKVNKYGKIMPSLQEQYNDLRELFSGNKLCTNAYRKFFMGCEQNEVSPNATKLPISSYARFQKQLSEDEIFSLKEKAKEQGIKYQTLLNEMWEELGENGQKPYIDSYTLDMNEYNRVTEEYMKTKKLFSESDENGLVVCPELEKRYVSIITEPISINYVHFYAFLVLVFKFGYFPTKMNIPKNLEKDFPNMKLWDVPDFCKYFVNNLDCEKPITVKNYLKIQ